MKKSDGQIVKQTAGLLLVTSEPSVVQDTVLSKANGSCEEDEKGFGTGDSRGILSVQIADKERLFNEKNIIGTIGLSGNDTIIGRA